jgi:vitamin B12 transporter
MRTNQLLMGCFLASVFYFIPFSDAFSQNIKSKQDTIKTVTVGEVVISATRDARNVADVPKSVTIIDMQKINSSIYSSVGDLLAKEAGIQLIGGGQNFGASQTMFIRGANSNHSIIMVDGVRIYDPSTVDNGIDLSELSLTNIDRIEIVEGPLSTMYGSSAIGGVINIITKKKDDKPVNAGIRIKGGTFGSGTLALNSDLYLNLNHKSGLYLNLSGYTDQVKGMNTTIDTITNPATYNHPDKDNFSKTDYAAKLGYKMKDVDVFVSYKHGSQRSDLDKGSYRDDDNRYLTFNRDLINYGLNYKLSKNFKIGFTGGYSVTKRQDIDDSSIVSNAGTYDHQYTKFAFDGTYLNNDILIYHSSKYISSVLGVENNVETMSSNSFIYSYSPYFGVYQNETNLDTLNLRTSTNGIFFHSDVNMGLISKFFDRLAIGIGARYSNHSIFGNNLTYEINPSYKIENSLIYFNYSTGYNAPSLYRLFAPDKSYGYYTTLGNRNLKPETSSNLEIGLKHYLSKESTFTISWFHTVIDNVIEYVYLWDKNIGIDTLGNNWMRNDYLGDTYINLSQQTVNGIEFNIVSRISKKLLINANFSLINGTTSYSTDNIDTVHTGGNHIQLFESGVFLSNKNNEVINLTRRPNAMANIGIVYQPLKKLSVIFDSKFVGSRNDVYFNPSLKPYGAMDRKLIGAYNVSDLQFNYEFSKKLLAALKIENILNTEYEEIAGFSSRPRGFFLKLAYTY